MAAANRNDIYVLREVVKKLIPMLVQYKSDANGHGSIRKSKHAHKTACINQHTRDH